MIPWGFGVGAVIAAIVYFMTGWVFLAWADRCPLCKKRELEDAELRKMGAILDDGGDYVGMEESVWLAVLQRSALEMIENRNTIDPEFDRGAVDQWRSILDSTTDLLTGYRSGKYGYDPARPDKY
jgi:hypothetical protein